MTLCILPLVGLPLVELLILVTLYITVATQFGLVSCQIVRVTQHVLISRCEADMIINLSQASSTTHIILTFLHELYRPEAWASQG